MRHRCVFFSFCLALVIFVGLGSNAAGQAPMDCTTQAFEDLGLTDIDGRAVTINNAEIVAAAAPLPEHCFVRGVIAPEHYFEVRLPTTTWNGKFYQVGGGGWDGSVNTQWQLGLGMNFATAAGSGGHLSPTTNALYAPGLHGFVFPLKEPYYTDFYDDLPADSPDPPNTFAGEMTVDFGYRSHGATAVLAKSMINAYYKEDPSYSYYVGCSNGGREALVVAQKYPTLFNGIVAGAPVISFVGTNMRGIWNNQYGTGPGGQAAPVIDLTEKGVALYQAVYGKCDSVDGLVDGFIDDPQRCPFDALTDLPACPGDVDADNCFTTLQRQALKNIYDGPYDTYRNPLYPGQPLSAEYLTPGTCFPQPCTPPPFSSGFANAVWDFYADNAGKYLFFIEPGGPEWSYMDFDWDVDPQRIRNNYVEDLDELPKQLSDIVDAATFDAINSPNMGGLDDFYNNGGKLIHYHGWSDALVSPAPSVNFYQAVVRGMGQTTVDSFYRLYMVPGMGHCGGGIGCYSGGSGNPSLWVDAIINWVESDETPQVLTGTRAENADPTYGWTARTRPLCPYPQVARYLGTGSIDEAANFTCATVVPATVDIKQTKVKVGKGSFKAMMTIPEGYTFGNKKDISAAVSEGASAKRIALNKKKGIISANFKMKDAIGITAGDAVIFTVTALFDEGGKTYALEGSDTVEVLEK